MFIYTINLLLLTTHKNILLDTGISKTWSEIAWYSENTSIGFESTDRPHFFTFLGIQYNPLNIDETNTVARESPKHLE